MLATPIIPLDCSGSALEALQTGASGLARDPHGFDWVIGLAFLHTNRAPLVLSSGVRVLSDGTVARPLSLGFPEQFGEQITDSIPDIAARMEVRGSTDRLPDPVAVTIPQPTYLFPPDQPCDVVIRIVERESAVHRIACGLLLEDVSGNRVAVGTDTTTLALVLLDDGATIKNYLGDCEVLSLADYCALAV